MAKTVVKIADLAQLKQKIDISENEQIEVRALNLREMVTLFIDSREVFLPLYSAAVEGKADSEQLSTVLLTAPEVVARIIALATDEPESAAIVEKNMPATVQLIALSEIWKASVPDPKKARELLSEVTALLQRLNEKVAAAAIVTPETPSPMTLQPQ